MPGDHARDTFLTMLIFCGATMAAVSLAVAYALRFFRRFQAALLTVSDGGYGARLDTKGPPEFASLARGFNHMAARLETYADSNQRLQRQILSVQEEERAGIARDLHDEVGPYLFAIQVDANAVAKSADPDARALGGAIRQAALHIQQHVKEILRQLRPVGSLDFGLEAAIADLVAFWSRRHPSIRFERAIASDPQLDRAGEDAAYRIVQESLSNAIRHGRPQLIRITVVEEADRVHDLRRGRRRRPATGPAGRHESRPHGVDGNGGTAAGPRRPTYDRGNTGTGRPRPRLLPKVRKLEIA